LPLLRAVAPTVAQAATTPSLAATAKKQEKILNLIAWPIYEFPENIQKFTEATGVRVKAESFPAKWEETLAKFTLWGESGYENIDVHTQDDQIAALYAFNDWCLDLAYLLTDEQKTDQADAVKGLTEAVGRQARMFFFVGGMPFMRNKTLMPEAPKTWDELVTMAKQATSPGDDVWGWRPYSGSHQWNLTLHILNHAGADTTTMEGDGALKALQFMHDWVFKDEISPKTIISEGQEEIIPLAADGKAGAWWGYEDGYGYIVDVQGKLTEDMIGVSRWPMGPADDSALVHGWGWMIPKFTAQKELAEQFVTFMSQKDLLKAGNIKAHNTPAYKSMYSDPEIAEAVPVLKAGNWEEVVRGAKFRCPAVCMANGARYTEVFNKAGLFVLSGEQTPEAAQAWAVDFIKKF
jgi:ABC-type glycerol-3-phosphate transport system substrate-binding protein